MTDIPTRLVEVAARAEYERDVAAECEVEEEFGHPDDPRSIKWHAHPCPETTARRLVIITPPWEGEEE